MPTGLLRVNLILCVVAILLSHYFLMGQIVTDAKEKTMQSSSWLGLNVVTFSKDEKKKSQLHVSNEKSKKLTPAALFKSISQKLFRRRHSSPNKSFDAANDGSTKCNISVSLPPKSMDESDWMRGVPTMDAVPTLIDIKSWNFDPLRYSSSALVPVFGIILQHYDIPTKFHISMETLDAFASKVEERHNPVSYHNFYHAITTLHMSFMLLTDGGADKYLEDLDIFSLLFAAFIHDVDHKGNNNAFEVNSKTLLSEKYAGQSVLENNSVDISFNEILAAEECDILSGLEENDRARILDLVKGLVLATDAANHGEMLEKVGQLKEEAESTGTGALVWNESDADSRFLLCSMIIHAADISNPVMPDFRVVKDWTLRISTEFRQQADKERDLGIDVTAFMDGLTDECSIAKQQEGFYKFMALPLFTVLSDVLPKASMLEKWGRKNLEHYVEIISTTDQWTRNNQQEAKEL